MRAWRAATIDELMAKAAEKAGVTAKAAEKAGVTVERIVAELAEIAFSDPRRALDWGMKQTEDGPVPYPDLLMDGYGWW